MQPTGLKNFSERTLNTFLTTNEEFKSSFNRRVRKICPQEHLDCTAEQMIRRGIIDHVNLFMQAMENKPDCTISKSKQCAKQVENTDFPLHLIMIEASITSKAFKLACEILKISNYLVAFSEDKKEVTIRPARPLLEASQTSREMRQQYFKSLIGNTADADIQISYKTKNDVEVYKTTSRAHSLILKLLVQWDIKWGEESKTLDLTDFKPGEITPFLAYLYDPISVPNPSSEKPWELPGQNIFKDKKTYYANLLENPVNPDMEIIVGEITIPAHRLFLNQCAYFQNLFNSGMKETLQSIPQLHLESFSENSVRTLLRYLYVGSIPATFFKDNEGFKAEDVLALLQLACFVQCEPLINICLNQIRLSASSEHVMDLIILNDKIQHPYLTSLIQYILKYEPVELETPSCTLSELWTIYQTFCEYKPDRHKGLEDCIKEFLTEKLQELKTCNNLEERGADAFIKICEAVKHPYHVNFYSVMQSVEGFVPFLKEHRNSPHYKAFIEAIL